MSITWTRFLKAVRRMSKECLEDRCRHAILGIAKDVKDINSKMTHFLENYREDYYKVLYGHGKY